MFLQQISLFQITQIAIQRRRTNFFFWKRKKQNKIYNHYLLVKIIKRFNALLLFYLDCWRKTDNYGGGIAPKAFFTRNNRTQLAIQPSHAAKPHDTVLTNILGGRVKRSRNTYQLGKKKGKRQVNNPFCRIKTTHETWFSVNEKRDSRTRNFIIRLLCTSKRSRENKKKSRHTTEQTISQRLHLSAWAW